jgi:hypothetical protein
VRLQVHGRHSSVAPMITCLDMFTDGRSGECVTDRCFVPGVDCGSSNVQLCHVERDPRDGGTVSGMNSLMIHGFVICITVQLCIEREIIVGGFVILMSFNMLESNLARGLVDRAYDHINYVPISLKSYVGEAMFEGTGGFHAFNEGVVVAAELDNPIGPSVTEVEEVMEESYDRQEAVSLGSE